MPSVAVWAVVGASLFAGCVACPLGDEGAGEGSLGGELVDVLDLGVAGHGGSWSALANPTGWCGPCSGGACWHP